ncbi:MAG: ribonuclease HI [Treponema sp.]|jgi:ribonuclease HI|nr:ribonuclease HI [Treponema sp.]
MDIHIYTDGGCAGNPGPGGWAYLIMRERDTDTEIIVEKWGAEPDTTNNRMELTAALNALEMFSKLNLASKEVIVHTDSQYVQKGMTEWIVLWKRNGWRTSDRTPVKNKDLWQRLDVITHRYSIQWKWVKGHFGNRFNERCDKMAQRAIASIRYGTSRILGN